MTLIVLFVSTYRVDAQCLWSGDLDIPDNDVIQIDFQIDGLLNNILGFNNGLCQVNLSFSHSSVGDLVMQLSAPSGQQIQLVGPLVNSNDTDFSKWNVQFVPCGNATAPDVGVGGQWNNLDDWGLFGDYQGSYHPASGCLEDFTGSANGEWRLTILDANPLDVGKILEVELIFCDNTGLICSNCALNAGTFDQQNYEFCILDITDERIFAQHPNLPDQTYNHLVFEADTLRNIVDTVELAGLPAGEYTICGLSVLDIHAYAWDSISIGDATLETLATLERIGACFDYTNRCAQLLIEVPMDTLYVDAIFCQGDSINVFDIWIKNEGIFTTTKPALSLCDTLVYINAQEVIIESLVTQNDSLGCKDDYVLLIGSEASHQPVSYTWRSFGGLPLTIENDSSVRIGIQDTIELITSYKGCYDTVNHLVIVKSDKLDVDLMVDTVFCETDSVQAFASASYDENEIIWRNITRNQLLSGKTVKLDVTETYEVYMGGDSYCSDTTLVTFEYDQVPPTIALEDTIFVCFNSLDTLIYENVEPSEMYHWSSPSGVLSNTNRMAISEEGYYRMTVTGRNQCQSQDSIYVQFYDTIPYSIRADKFRCDDTTATFRFEHLGRYDSVFTYFGQQLISSDTIVLVDQIGRYFIQAFDENNCEIQRSIDLNEFYETEKPMGVDQSIYTCDSNFVFYEARLAEQMTAEWQASGQTLSVDSVFRSMNYFPVELITADENGCLWDTLLVPSVDTMKPSGLINVSGRLNCKNDTIILFDEIGEMSVVRSWSTSDGSIVAVQNDTAFIDESGTYKLVLKKTDNGCETDLEIFVEEQNGSFLIDTLQVSNPICPNDSTGFVQIVPKGDYDTPISYSESMTPSINENGLFSGLPSGNYLFRATDANGCKDSILIELIEPISSQLVIPSDTSLFVGDQLRLNALLIPSQPSTSGSWSINNLVICQNCSDTTIVVSEDAEFLYVASDENGCLLEGVFQVTVLEKDFAVYIPNTFSPNGDALNDVWRPYFSFDKVLEFELEIFNRWGGKVFESKGTYPNQAIEWNGILKGETLSVDTYVYLLNIKDLDGNNQFLSGEIVLFH